jgi:hypothetical protein
VKQGLAALLGAALLASCVARQPYEPTPSGSGGSLELGGSASNSAGMDVGGAGTPPEGAECKTSGQCAPPRPYCVGNLGVCVECLAHRNCTGTGRGYCNTKTYSCVRCLGDSQCAPAAPYCDTALGDCVECLTSDNCGGDNLACDRNAHTCVPSCQANADCEGTPLLPFCDPVRNLCVACLGDQDCPADTPRCSQDTRRCVGCLESGDCGPPTRLCDELRHLCAQCLSNGDCQGDAPCVDGSCVAPP